MHCPFCRNPDSRVVDSRTSDDGSTIRRRRQCPSCNRRFTTVETASLSVVKRSGATEPFSREKIAGGVRKACQGRPVSEDDLALLAQKVEETLRAAGSAEIDAYEIGLAILGPLRELDEVAYLRFASVYQAFDSLEDFEAAITVLRAEHETDTDPAADADVDGAATWSRRRADSHGAPTERPVRRDACGTLPRHRFGLVLPTDIELLHVPGPPTVLPDGTRAVVSVVHPRLSDDEYTGGLWMVPLGGDGAPSRLTRGHRDTAPVVSADGRWVRVSCAPSRAAAKPAGARRGDVGRRAGPADRMPRWAPSSPRISPDGSRVAYLARVPESGPVRA